MTKLRKQSETPQHIYTCITEIQSVQVDGNTTHLELNAVTIIDEKSRFTHDKKIIVEIPTLELIQTFNTTWTNHAIAKLKTWINQLSK